VSTGTKTKPGPAGPPRRKAAKGAFQDEAADVLQRLRTTFAAVIEGVPARVSKPAELQRALDIDFKLSCKILRVVSAVGPLAGGPHVPGRGALRTFLGAARAAGVQARLVDAASEASREFDRLVAAHAGNRTTFDSMISSLAATEDARQITMQHRRAAFRSQSHIFGLQAGVQLKCMVLQPAADADKLDLVRITGFLALRQMRPDAPLIVPRVRLANDDGTPRQVVLEPLDPNWDPEAGVPLLNDFCSQPLPRFRTVQPDAGDEYGELVSDGIGSAAAINFVEGHIVRGAAPRYRDEGNQYGANFARVRIPCEVLIIDLLVHDEAYGPLNPVSYSRAEHFGEVPYLRMLDESLQIQPREPVVCLGKGCSVLYTGEVPRYTELGRYVFERLGADPERFNVYRLRVEYPVLPSTVAIGFRLPDPPERKTG
jgi:hypothetical protein